MLNEVKKQMTDLVKELPVAIQEEFAEDLCVNYNDAGQLPEFIAERMVEADLSKHFNNDCNDYSGLSYQSVTAGTLCDSYGGEENWEVCVPLLVLWITKKPLSQKNKERISQMIEGYEEYHACSDVSEDYTDEMKGEYVAECVEPSEILDFVKLVLAILYSPDDLREWIENRLEVEQDGMNKKIYHEWAHFLE